ncbi:nucleotidyl transferase AbiEii/AbiGii toxin family protein [Thalassoglobus sp. JC818]|uniref:nucleotidyl transferase AbiEii/AbiGii toxin family protein n=1 Tax=Thalassoglobus sp. JC818 TaxID=3232136 RepID=UPI003458B672
MKWIRKLLERAVLRPTSIVRITTAASRTSSKSKIPQSTPSTLEAGIANSGTSRPKYFDPALRHFVEGFRAGEPQFASPDVEKLWQTNRLKVLHHILKLISESECAEHLVLRGSVLLRTWFGEQARQPGDLDWVVTPQNWSINQQPARKLIEELVELLRGSVVDDSLHIPDTPFATDEIWTYEKAPGRRIIVPWKTSDPRLNGTIQMDFVFGEAMPSQPQFTDVIVGPFSPIPLRTATIEQSLAWKLLWLATDCFAMGKDLYDAVLLAEHSKISADLLKRTFEADETLHYSHYRNFTAEEIQNWSVEWDDFVKEYPTIPGTAVDWKQRLQAALKPLFQEIAESQLNKQYET